MDIKESELEVKLVETKAEESLYYTSYSKIL